MNKMVLRNRNFINKLPEVPIKNEDQIKKN